MSDSSGWLIAMNLAFMMVVMSLVSAEIVDAIDRGNQCMQEKADE